MRKKIIISNWINIVCLGIYIAVISTTESVYKDFDKENIIVNIAGNVTQSALMGLFYPFTWGLPITLLFILLLILSDFLIIKEISRQVFIIQTVALSAILFILIFAANLQITHLLFIPFFATGQYIRFKKLRKVSS